MPNYRIVVQTNVLPSARFRAARATDRSGVETIEVTATTLTNALLKVGIQLGREKRSPRIVSAEEVLDIDTDEITDDQITQALTGAVDPLDPDDYDGITVYDEDDFEWTVNRVVEALRESALVPGLNLSILMNSEGYSDYTMIEIYDTASDTYRSVGREAKHLIDDRSLTGWDGILSIARAVIGIVAAQRLL